MVRDNKRRFSRFHGELKAQYFLKEHKASWKECTVTNISRKGAGIRFHPGEKINVGSTIHLEIFLPTELEPLAVEGVILRIDQAGNNLVGSIELTKLLDENQWSKIG